MMRRSASGSWILVATLCVIVVSAGVAAARLPGRGLGAIPSTTSASPSDDLSSEVNENPSVSAFPSAWFKVYDRPLRVLASSPGVSLAFAYHPGIPSYRLPDLHWVSLTPGLRGLKVAKTPVREREVETGDAVWRLGFLQCGDRGHVWNKGSLGGAGRAVLSPSGSQLALGDEAGQGIWVTDSEGSSPPIRLTSPVDPSAFGPALSREGFVPMWAGLPQWSPDGKTLYFLTNRNAGLVELWQLVTDSGKETCVYSSAEGELYYLVGVTADGHLLLYVQGKVLVLEPSGDMVASFPFKSVAASWSPSRERVAVLDGEAGRLYFLESTNLTEAPELPEGFDYGSIQGVWSEDSQSFATYAERRPTRTVVGEKQLLILSGVSGDYTSKAFLDAPEGYVFNLGCPVSWVGRAYVLAVVYPPNHLSDGPHETWAYNLGVE